MKDALILTMLICIETVLVFVTICLGGRIAREIKAYLSANINLRKISPKRLFQWAFLEEIDVLKKPRGDE